MNKNQCLLYATVLSINILLSGCYKPNQDSNTSSNNGSYINNNKPIGQDNKGNNDNNENGNLTAGNLIENIPRDILNTANHLYVANSGDDSNSGTKENPFKTILKASQVARPDTTIHVAPGIYQGGFKTTANGLVSHRIRYVSDVKYGAKINNADNTSESLWDNRGNYTDIDGFEFDGTNSLSVTSGIFLGGSFSQALNNKVHHIATDIPCSSKGAAGIKTDNYYGGVYLDVVNNIVHDVGINDCTFNQGIYLSTSGTAHNNLIYSISSTAISSWHNATNLTITNNTIFGNQIGITIGAGDFYNGYNKPNDYSVVANNIVYDNRQIGIDEEGNTGKNNLYMNNLVYKNGQKDWALKNGNTHTGSLNVDPQFVNYQLNGTGDYSLKSTSLAIDSGMVGAWNPLTDLNEKKRVQGKSIDLGAYEYGNEPTNSNIPVSINTSSGNSGEDTNVSNTNHGKSNEENNPEPGKLTPSPILDTPTNPNAGLSNSPSTNGEYNPNDIVSINNLYVSPNGSDSNAGTKESPFRTIQKAAKEAQANTTVHVAPSTYNENIKTTVSGSSNARIRYVSDVKWGAKIVGSGTESTWTNSGNYTDIVGFDVSGTGRLGILNNASYSLMRDNHVHDLKVSGGCNGGGGAGINNGNYDATDNDIIGNVVHDIGIPGSCIGVQGIYHSNLRGNIKNNIVYRASAFGIHLWHAANNVMINNNTVFNNGSKSMGGGIVIGTGDSPGGIVLDHTNVTNNIVYDNPLASIVEYCYAGENCIGNNNIISNNIVYNNGQKIKLKVGQDTNTIESDPQFINYQANGGGDYNVKPTSPAITSGMQIGAL